MWRYHARRMNGDGTNTNLRADVPLENVTADRELSGGGGFDAEISIDQRLFADDGKPLFVPWSTAVFVEKDGHIFRNGFIVTEVTDDIGKLALSGIGFAGYPDGMPFTGDYSGVAADPLDIFRMLWGSMQAEKQGNLGLTIDGLKSNKTVGKALPADANSSAEGPYVLGWWETHDIGKAITDLATLTPFDFVVDHKWSGNTVAHNIRLGVPGLGSRRADLRFVLGENLLMPGIPITYDGESYASEAWVLGAGEGRKMVRAGWNKETDRLRRSVIVQEKSLADFGRAEAAARAELQYRLGTPDITELEITDHPHAPIGSYDVGDEIRVTTKTGFHGDLDMWLRILEISTTPDTNSEILKVQRSEKG